MDGGLREGSTRVWVAGGLGGCTVGKWVVGWGCRYVGEWVGVLGGVL